MIQEKPNILINRQSAGGDVLMTTPIIRKIYQDRRGQCNIDFFVHPECLSYLGSNPYLRNVYTGLPTGNIISNYDIIYNLDLVYEKNPLIHAVDAYAMYVFGHCDFDRSLELHTRLEEQEQAREIHKNLGDYIVIHQRRYAWPSRNISEKFWQGVVKILLEHTTMHIVQVGSPHEPVITGSNRLIDARGQLTIGELKEVISNSRLYMGVDSGPAHVASATDTDMIVLYTSVREEYRRPLRSRGKFIPVTANIECYGCHAKNPTPCTTFICHRGDIECVNRFDHIQVANMALSILK